MSSRWQAVLAACVLACSTWMPAASGAATHTHTSPSADVVTRAAASSRSFGFITEWPYFDENGPAEALAVDDSGNVFVATMPRVYRYTSRGTYVSDWGSDGSGGEDFGMAVGVAADRFGHVYVLDGGWDCVRKFTNDGVPIAQWGSVGTGPGEFGYDERAIATDDSGNVYVSDGGNCRIEKFTSSGAYVTQWGSCGTGDGEFYYPGALAIDHQGHVYVADSDSPRLQQFTTDGVHLATWPLAVQALAVDAGADLYAVDEEHQQVIHLDAAGHELDRWGIFGWERGQFMDPACVAVEVGGSVLVADRDVRRVEEFGVADRWRITATAGPHGRIAPDTSVDVAAGMSQPYLAVPDPGYRIATMTVDGAPAGTSAGYTFSGVTEDHTIEAAFTPLVGWPRDPLLNLPVAAADGWPRSLQVVSDGAGGTILAWSDYRIVNGTWALDVRMQRVDALGRLVWPGRGVSLQNSTGYLGVERLVADGSGGAIVLWADNPDHVNNWDLHVQRVNAAGAARWAPGGVSICPDPYGQTDADMVTDGSGGVIVTWSVDINGSPRDLFAQHVDSTGTLRWGTCGLNFRSHDFVEHPQLAPDGGGGAIVVWRELRDFYNAGDFYAQHLGGDGTLRWNTNGVPVCEAAGSQYGLALVPDGSGGVIAAWQDERNAPADPSGTDRIDVYAQRVDASGLPRWPANGVPLCTTAGNPSDLRGVADGAGGIFVGWADDRTGAYHVYVQHVNAGGMSLWPANGLMLGAPGGQHQMGALVADGAGGVITMWSETRDFAQDAVAQRVSAGGTPSWPQAGVVVAAGRGIRQEIEIMGDGLQGAIAGWIDSRDRYGAIYAQRVDANGWLGGAAVTAVPAAGPRPVLRLESPAPNPQRSGLLNVRFSLAGTAPARLELLDVSGRRVALREVGSLGAGPHVIQLDEGARLAPGLYFVRLAEKEATCTVRLVVLR